MTALQEPLTPDVRTFVARERLSDALATSIRLVGEYFPEARDLRVALEWDPENPAHEWISVFFLAAGPVSDVIERDNRMLDRWIQEVCLQDQGKVIVTFGIQ